MAVKHGSSKKVLYKNSLCLRGKYKGKYLGQLRKPTAFGELKQMSWFGHTNRIPETSIVKRIQEDQLESPSLDGKMMSGMI